MRQCETKYPIMLTGFRDRKLLGYWGRISKVLEENGARVFYGNQDSWGTIKDNATTIRRTLEECLARSQAGKVNIIAHSKGGLEARYLVSSLGSSACVASVTTIATPHHGSRTMDHLMRIPSPLFKAAATITNGWFKLLGDSSPRFYEACRQFTTGYMLDFNEANADVEGVYDQSYASAMSGPFSDVFMLVPYVVTKIVEGENDGLVTPMSAAWTNFQGVWRGGSRRGISHADSVDARRRRLSRRNTQGVTDITHAYLEIVASLQHMGL